MAMLLIGNNAGILASKNGINAAVGSAIQQLRRALLNAHNLKSLIDQQAVNDLKTLDFGDGTAGSADEIGYLKTALNAGDNLYLISLGQAPAIELPFDHDGPMKYVSATL